MLNFERMQQDQGIIRGIFDGQEWYTNIYVIDINLPEASDDASRLQGEIRFRRFRPRKMDDDDDYTEETITLDWESVKGYRT